MIYLLQLSLHTGEYRAGSAISHLVLQIGQHSIKEMEKSCLIGCSTLWASLTELMSVCDRERERSSVDSKWLIETDLFPK